MHFTVMVLTNGTKTVDELLAPFDENIEVEPYICRTKEEIISDAKERASSIKKDLQEKKENGEEYKLSVWEEELLNAKTDEDFYECFHYEDELYDEAGNELSTYNPKSKWDWYQIGGRWEGLLKAKKGYNAHSPSLLMTGSSSYSPPEEGHYDCAMLKDLEFDIDPEEYKKAERYWEVVVEGSPLRKGENEDDFRNFYRKEYYIDEYGTKENYAKVRCTLTTYAVLTPDGKWYDKYDFDEISDPTIPNKSLDWNLNFKERFVDAYDPNTVVTIVDCHI